MAIPVYLFVYDENERLVKGSVDVKDREGSIEVLGLHHNVSFSTDVRIGRATAKRTHRPFLIEKEIDSSSVYLYKALTTGETFSKAVFKYYRINHSGQEEEYFTITLEGVKVCNMFSLMHDVKEIGKEKFNHMEITQFKFKKITWHYLDGNISHTDDWDIRVTA